MIQNIISQYFRHDFENTFFCITNVFKKSDKHSLSLNRLGVWRTLYTNYFVLYFIYRLFVYLIHFFQTLKGSQMSIDFYAIKLSFDLKLENKM